MDFYKEFKSIENKLATVLAAESLVYTFRRDFPIELIISQDQSMDAQMELFSVRDGGSCRDAVLKFVFRLDGIEVQTDSRFVMSDALFSKIKGIAKKMHYAYLQAVFAEATTARMETGIPALVDMAPEAVDSEADDAEPIEGVFKEFFDEDSEDNEEVNRGDMNVNA